MNLVTWANMVSLADSTEVDKVCLLAFYFLQTDKVTEFSVAQVVDWFGECNLPRPNTSRLRTKLSASPAVIRGSKPGVFRLHAKTISQLSSQYPTVGAKSEEVISSDSVLPEPVFAGTRGYIEALARQINASYEHNIFDGCAVLMRRLLEVLLIHSYQHLGIEGEIKDPSGNYLLLEGIATHAKSSGKLDLSRNTKSALDDFRKLGNFSAHKIHYNAKREDVRRVLLDYRAAIEELLYKSGIRT